MSTTVVVPPADPGDLDELHAALAQTSATPSVRDALTGALHALANGVSVRIEPVPEFLTTSEAADLLNISRTTMVRLLDEGKLPYERPNVHRLVRLRDVLAYKERRSTQRREFLTESMRQAQADGLADLSPEDYEPALARARHQDH
jgi:excisionase family DNA binding protein